MHSGRGLTEFNLQNDNSLIIKLTICTSYTFTQYPELFTTLVIVSDCVTCPYAHLYTMLVSIQIIRKVVFWGENCRKKMTVNCRVGQK